MRDERIDVAETVYAYATGITPAMAMKMVGVGAQYACAFVDSEGRPLDGSRTYKVHLPPGIPAKDFWSVTVYDPQTRSLLQTDQRFPSVGRTVIYSAQDGIRAFDVTTPRYRAHVIALAGGANAGSAATFALSLFSATANRFLNLEISALEAEGKGNIVSSPRVITADQTKALIEQGTELPYQVATS